MVHGYVLNELVMVGGFRQLLERLYRCSSNSTERVELNTRSHAVLYGTTVCSGAWRTLEKGRSSLTRFDGLASVVTIQSSLGGYGGRHGLLPSHLQENGASNPRSMWVYCSLLLTIAMLV